jgi:hypothetical protein
MGLLCQYQTIFVDEYGALVAYVAGDIKVLGIQPAVVLFKPPQIPQSLYCDRTKAYTVSRRSISTMLTVRLQIVAKRLLGSSGRRGFVTVNINN